MNPNTTQIRISDIIFAVLKRWVLVAVCTAIGLVVGVILSGVNYLKGEISKKYVITESIAVTSQNENGMFTSASKDPNSNDIYLAEEMVDSVIYVLKSDRTLNDATEKLQLIGVSAADINNNLTISQYNETQIIEVSLYWRSAQEGVEILEAINSVAPGILQETLKIGNVSVVNQPTSKYLIGGSLNASMWVYMAVFGLIVGAGIAVLELLLRPTLINVKDAERMFKLEILGEIPENKTFFKKRRSLLLESEDDDPLIIDNYVSFAHIVRNRLKDKEHQCIYVTSATEGEGKTTVTANLAVQLAELEKKVLLIDFDNRNPKLGGLFLEKVEYEHSFNALYRGDSTKEDAITSLTGYLDILPTVLERKAMPLDEEIFSLVRELSQDYDYVIMDTSPIGRVADTMSLNRIADVAVFVMRFDHAVMDQIRDSLERMDKSGIRVLGCVVNAVKASKSKAYGKYGYGYGYGGAKPEKKSKPEYVDRVPKDEDVKKTSLVDNETKRIEEKKLEEKILKEMDEDSTNE